MITQEEARNIFTAETIEKYPELDPIHIADLGMMSFGDDEKYYMFAVLRGDDSPLNIGLIVETDTDEYHVFWNDTPNLFAESAKEEFGEDVCVEFEGFEYEDEKKTLAVPVYCAIKNDKPIGIGCFIQGEPVWWYIQKNCEKNIKE